MILSNKHKTNTTNQRKNKNNLKESIMKNNKGFTLIELIMVTIILGILAAVAIPRYMTSVTEAEKAAEDAVISAITAGLEQYATEQLMATGNRSWPANPWTALATTPAGYDATDSDDADTDGEWTFNSSSSNITHMRNDGTVHHWDYAVTGDNLNGDQTTGTLGGREAGAGD
jgi:prepilin-type N-terminal cleavage/methylation domain-containing protein